MDIPRPSFARERRRRRILLAAAGLAAVAAITVGLSRLKPAAPSVDKAVVYTDTVKRGDIPRDVRGNGTLVPEEINWIPAMSPGRVERILVLPGAVVKADTVIVELSNPEVEHASFEAEWQLRGAEAQYTKLQVQLESDLLNQKANAAVVTAESKVAKLDAEADEKLAADGLVDRLTAIRSRTKSDQLNLRCELDEKRLQIAEEANKATSVAQQAELAKLRALVDLKHKQLAQLKVRAGIDGVLQRLGDREQLQVGQQLGAGANIARVANPSKLKAEIKVVETQAKDIQHGQSAIIDTRNGTVPGHVVRIDPAVQNGTVTVDVALDGPLPKGARPDLSVEGTIKLELLENVLYVGRPANGQAESKVGLFKVVDGGKAAIQVPVKLGRGSVNTIEIISGLEIGDRVILSDMAQYSAYERVRLD
jgi:HlyD family secretion protein